MEESKTWASFHEAGHIVAMFFHQIPVDSVKIEPNENGKWGGRVFPDMDMNNEGLMQSQIEDKIISLLAGNAAEKKAKGSHGEGFLHDYGLASQLFHVSIYEEGFSSKYIDVMLEKTNEFVSDKWYLVEAIQKELFLKENLSFMEIKQKIESEYGNPSWMQK